MRRSIMTVSMTASMAAAMMPMLAPTMSAVAAEPASPNHEPHPERPGEGQKGSKWSPAELRAMAGKRRVRPTPVSP